MYAGTNRNGLAATNCMHVNINGTPKPLRAWYNSTYLNHTQLYTIVKHFGKIGKKNMIILVLIIIIIRLNSV